MTESTQQSEMRQVLMRGLFMLVVFVFYHVAELVVLTVAVFQFGWLLITRQQNEPLQTLGEGLSRYIYQAMRFLTFNSEEKPFPFSDWPGSPPVQASHEQPPAPPH